jgi:hypothetical protein
MGILFKGNLNPTGLFKVASNLPPIWNTISGSLGTISANVPFTYTLNAIDPENGLVSYSIFSGILPNGMSLSSNQITGTPTNNPGVYNFTVRASDGVFSNDRAFSLTIVNDAPIWTTTNGGLGTVIVGSTFNYALSAIDPNGDTITYSVSAGSLPAGITLNVATGELSGIPTTPGLANFTIRATDSKAASADQAFTIDVTNGSTIVATFVKSNFNAWTYGPDGKGIQTNRNGTAIMFNRELGSDANGYRSLRYWVKSAGWVETPNVVGGYTSSSGNLSLGAFSLGNELGAYAYSYQNLNTWEYKSYLVIRTSDGSVYQPNNADQNKVHRAIVHSQNDGFVFGSCNGGLTFTTTTGSSSGWNQLDTTSQSYNMDTAFVGGISYLFALVGSQIKIYQQGGGSTPVGTISRVASSISCSADGSVLAVGDGNTAVGGITSAGAVYIYQKGTGWNSWGTPIVIEHPLPVQDARFGVNVKLSDDGTKLVVSQSYTATSSPTNPVSYLFTNTGSGWEHTATYDDALFITISGDGNKVFTYEGTSDETRWLVEYVI